MSTSCFLSKYCFRNPGATHPALGFAQSFWALTQRALPIAEALEQAAAKGYEYLEVGLHRETLGETKTLLEKFPLKLIAQGWATSADEATIFFERSQELGAQALNMHLGHAYMTTNEAVELVGAVQRQANSYGIPLLVETHRGRVTQDLFRTFEFVRQMPELAMTLDVSHYIVAGETLGGPEPSFRTYLDSVLAQTGLIHGRISNGQSIQVAADDSFAFTRVIQSVWQRAMSLWLSEAPRDAIFVFEPELGPPPYSYLDREGKETFDRTIESRSLVGLARESWNAAQVAITLAKGH